jgi:hypothetical protein
MRCSASYQKAKTRFAASISSGHGGSRPPWLSKMGTMGSPNAPRRSARGGRSAGAVTSRAKREACDRKGSSAITMESITLVRKDTKCG